MRRVKLWMLSSLPLLLILSGLALPAVSQEQPAMLWIKTFDGGSSDQARDVAVDSMDNVIVTGISVKGTENYMTVKYDGNGNQVWNRTYEDGNQAHSVAVDSMDNIVVTGFSFNGYTDSFLTIKYDKDGNMLWSRRHGEEWQGEGVATDSRNNVIVVGYYYVEDVMGQWDIIIVKCDSNGNQIWSRTYDDLEGERAFDVAVDSKDNILITGMSYDGMTRNLIAIKFDKDGNLLWTRTYNGGYEDEGHGVAVDSMDNVIMTGFTSDDTYRSFLTIKYDKDGNMLWTKTNREEPQDEAYSVTVDSNDNILVTGWSFDGTTRNLTTIEYDRDGNQVWITFYEGSPTHGSLVEIWGYGVAVDSMDNIVVAGAIFFIEPQKLSDFFTIKYGSEALNLPPVVSDPSPLDGAEGVKVDLSTLSFSISDPESGLMDYHVATDPDVGSVEKFDQSGGRYSIPLSGPLSYSTTYEWRVSVTDGTSWTNKTYTFTTEPKLVNRPPIVSDPSSPDGATVSTSLSELSFTISDPDGDPMDYYVTTDPSIGEGSNTGVSDGTYTVPVSGLNPEATYTWRVSVTDGTSWTNVTYSFLAVAHVETYGFNVVQEDTTHHVTILSNSSVSGFSFDQTKKLISFDVTGPRGTRGACDVTFPKELLDSPFEVTVNGRSIDFVLTQNATHNSLYFSYTHGTQTVRIIGTVVEPRTAIPEFYILILIIAVSAVIAVTIIYLVRSRKKVTKR